MGHPRFPNCVALSLHIRHGRPSTLAGRTACRAHGRRQGDGSRVRQMVALRGPADGMESSSLSRYSSEALGEYTGIVKGTGLHGHGKTPSSEEWEKQKKKKKRGGDPLARTAGPSAVHGSTMADSPPSPPCHRRRKENTTRREETEPTRRHPLLPPLPRKTSSRLVARPLSLRRSVLHIGSQLDDDPLRKGDTTQQHLPPGACPPSFADGAISIFAPAPGRCAEIGSASSCFCETIL